MEIIAFIIFVTLIAVIGNNFEKKISSQIIHLEERVTELEEKLGD